MIYENPQFYYDLYGVIVVYLIEHSDDRSINVGGREESYGIGPVMVKTFQVLLKLCYFWLVL